MSRQVRVLRVAVPVLFVAGILTVAAVFFRALDQGPLQLPLGPEPAIRAAVAQRPKRVCLGEITPCAWIAVTRGELYAFSTNGPLPQEFGARGVGWCPSSGRFGANATGSRWDAAGNVVRGPAPRGLDEFTLLIRDGLVTVDFGHLSAGLPAWRVDEVIPATGPECEQIPFDRDADLEGF